MSIPNPEPIYLQDSNGGAWLITVNDQARPILLGGITVPPSIPILPFILINDISSGVTWRMVALPSPAHPSAPSSRYDYTQTISNPGSPTQLLVTAPNGVIYALQISNGRLESALPNPSSYNCSTMMSMLAGNVQDRLEEPRGAGIFWNLTTEIYTGLVEAMNDMMVLVGRPTQSVGITFNLAPNTVWQQVPKGIFLISDIYGATKPLRKVSVFSMDYVQASWGAEWECDTSAAGPVRWGPVGMTQFFVHPAPSVPMSVTMNAIAYPVAERWPYNGTEIVPFQHEFHEALEMYCAHYARIKEMGAEFQTSMVLYQNYLSLCERMSMIQDRQDSLVFSRSLGAVAGVNPIVRR